MALYLGSNKQKISLNGEKYCFNIFSKSNPVISDIRLLSSDNYILKDSKGLYLIPKEVK